MRGGYDPGRIRRQLRTVRIERMFRVIHQSLRTRPLSAVPAPSRFSDPAAEYAVLYAAETVPCCFWEAVVRNRLTRSRRRELPRVDVERRLVVSLETRADLTLVDLRGMDRSRSVPPRPLHTTPTTPQAALCPRLPLPMFPRPMDSCSSHGSQGINASRYLTVRPANCSRSTSLH